MTMEAPRGVVAIWFSSDGEVLATATDFDTQKPAGFTLVEAQELRVRARICRAIVDDCCPPFIAEHIPGRTLEKIAAAMLDGGHRVAIERIGHAKTEEGQ